jgi:hypothetical protein
MKNKEKAADVVKLAHQIRRLGKSRPVMDGAGGRICSRSPVK